MNRFVMNVLIEIFKNIVKKIPRVSYKKANLLLRCHNSL